MITPDMLTDEMVLEFFVNVVEPDDPMRLECIRAMSTDSSRRYQHESTDAFWKRKQERQAARERIAAAINALKESGRG